MNTQPTHIIVNDLNKLRWLYPNQCFVSNVFGYSQKTVTILTNNNIGFSLAIQNWGDYQIVEGEVEEDAFPSINNKNPIVEETQYPPRISSALSGLINSLPSDYF